MYYRKYFLSSNTGTNNVDWKPLVNAISNIKMLFIKSEVSYVISLFPKKFLSNDVDFTHFNDRLTVAFLVSLRCVMQTPFPVSNVGLFFILCLR